MTQAITYAASPERVDTAWRAPYTSECEAVAGAYQAIAEELLGGAVWRRQR